MDKRRIGRFEVSVVGLGCAPFGTADIDETRTREIVDAALDEGITLFDTADIYGERGRSEELLGRALGSRRDDVVLATKYRQPMSDDGRSQGASARWIVQAVEGSLRRLGTDRIDLYQQHAPDPDVPIEETLTALHRLVRDGKVLEIGCSNFGSEQIEEAQSASARVGAASFVSVQNHYSLLHREPEKDVLATCRRHALAFLPYFPLEYGLLTGKYRRGEPPPPMSRLGLLSADWQQMWMNDANLDQVDRLQQVADRLGHSLAELAIAWLVAQPDVTSVLIGASRPSQVHSNAAAAQWRMTQAEVAEVDRVTTTRAR